MNVLRHWWLIVGSDGHAYEVRNAQPDTSPEGIDFSFKDRVVEVAPVNQPPGAITTLREALREVYAGAVAECDELRRERDQLRAALAHSSEAESRWLAEIDRLRGG